jgi:hypothetical protein
MHWEIRWRHAAFAMLRHIDWHDASRVDAAVIRFARSGEGDLEWVQGSRADYRLLVPGYSILIELHSEEHVLEVWSVNRHRR